MVEGSTLVTAVSEITESNSFTISSVFPNPVIGGAIRLEVFSTKKQVSELRIFDPKGVVVFAKTFDLHSGENRLKLSDLTWAEGIYFLVLKSKNGFATTKVVVL